MEQHVLTCSIHDEPIPWASCKVYAETWWLIPGTRHANITLKNNLKLKLVELLHTSSHSLVGVVHGLPPNLLAPIEQERRDRF